MSTELERSERRALKYIRDNGPTSRLPLYYGAWADTCTEKSPREFTQGLEKKDMVQRNGRNYELTERGKRALR